MAFLWQICVSAEFFIFVEKEVGQRSSELLSRLSRFYGLFLSQRLANYWNGPKLCRYHLWPCPIPFPQWNFQNWYYEDNYESILLVPSVTFQLYHRNVCILWEYTKIKFRYLHSDLIRNYDFQLKKAKLVFSAMNIKHLLGKNAVFTNFQICVHFQWCPVCHISNVPSVTVIFLYFPSE